MYGGAPSARRIRGGTVVAELLFIGTELLLGQILNTNAQFLSGRLAEVGINVYRQTVVGDNASRVAQCVREALGRADVLITSGGLGPTADDLTKEVIAEVTGRALVPDAGAMAALEGFFAVRGREMTPNNRKQAYVPAGALALPNPRGTAPGVYLEDAGHIIVMLPGPPHELEPMFNDEVLPRLCLVQGDGQTIVSRELRFCGIGESEVEFRVTDLIDAQSDVTIAPLASLGEVRLRLTCRASSQAAGLAKIAPVEAEIRRRLGGYIFGVDRETLAAVVARLLADRQVTIALAESCTGGLLGDMLTDIPGISASLLGGVLAYANESKTAMLDVPVELLAAHGAVSEQVCGAMAAGIRKRSGAALGVGITGIAGPSGATADKPVGLVYIGLAHGEDQDAIVHVERHRFTGDRRMIKVRAARQALVMLRDHLLLGPGSDVDRV